MYPLVTQKSLFLDFLVIFILYYAILYILTCIPSFKGIHPCFQNAHKYKSVKFSGQLECEHFLNGLSIHPTCMFIPSYAVPHTNLHTTFQKNLSIFAKSIPNTNLLRFHISQDVKNFQVLCELLDLEYFTTQSCQSRISVLLSQDETQSYIRNRYVTFRSLVELRNQEEKGCIRERYSGLYGKYSQY